MENTERARDNGAAVQVGEAPNSYQMPPRNENPTPLSYPSVAATTADHIGLSTGKLDSASKMKKKRGRPKKYGPDGKRLNAISPMPISASIPLTGDYSPWKGGRGGLVGQIKKSRKFEYGTSGQDMAHFVGTNFTPKVITVKTGEDLTMKIMSFSQQGSQAVCILSANGTISNVTLRQPTTFGGTLTYEGRFEILTLTGSFMPTEKGGQKSRSGGMSVSLAGPDGRVFGGGIAGLLIAGGPVQVVIGSFLLGHHQQKQKKQRTIHAPTITIPPPPTVRTISKEELKTSYEVKPIQAPTPFSQGNNHTPLNLFQGLRNSTPENDTSSPAEDSKGTSQSDYEVSS